MIYNIGINDADYPVQIKEELPSTDGKRKQKLVWICPFYKTWKSMIVRCYSPKYQQKNPTYRDCTVCEEWLVFSKFKSWMEQQEWEFKHLDKDFIVAGNKLYSPETCIFIDQKLNKFLNDHSACRGDLPLGVCLYRGKYQAQISVNGKQVKLGFFDTAEQAHLAWKKEKNRLAIALAKEQNDVRIKQTLLSRYKE